MNNDASEPRASQFRVASRCAQRVIQPASRRDAAYRRSLSAVSPSLTFWQFLCLSSRYYFIYARHTSAIDSRRANRWTRKRATLRDTRTRVSYVERRTTGKQRSGQQICDTSRTSTGDSRTCHVSPIRSVHLHFCLVHAFRGTLPAVSRRHVISVFFLPRLLAVFFPAAPLQTMQNPINTKFISTRFQHAFLKIKSYNIIFLSYNFLICYNN